MRIKFSYTRSVLNLLKETYFASYIHQHILLLSQKMKVLYWDIFAG